MLSLSSIAASSLSPLRAAAAEIDARPPDRLTLSAYSSRLIDVDNGGGGSLNWLHYFTPGAILGLGAEHQFIADAKLTFGSVRGALSHGEAASRFTVFGEANYGSGDDSGRGFDYGVAALGLNRALTQKLSVEIEGRQIDIDKSHGNLPKLGLNYVLTPHLLSYVSYAHSVGGNLGTELTSARLDYYGRRVTMKIGGSAGRADPSVLVLQPGITLPAAKSRQGFVGIGKSFSRGEVQLLGDYLKTGDSKKVTLTLSFTAYLGSRGRAQ